MIREHTSGTSACSGGRTPPSEKTVDFFELADARFPWYRRGEDKILSQSGISGSIFPGPIRKGVWGQSPLSNGVGKAMDLAHSTGYEEYPCYQDFLSAGFSSTGHPRMVLPFIPSMTAVAASSGTSTKEYVP